MVDLPLPQRAVTAGELWLQAQLHQRPNSAFARNLRKAVKRALGKPGKLTQSGKRRPLKMPGRAKNLLLE